MPCYMIAPANWFVRNNCGAETADGNSWENSRLPGTDCPGCGKHLIADGLLCIDISACTNTRCELRAVVSHAPAHRIPHIHCR